LGVGRTPLPGSEIPHVTEAWKGYRERMVENEKGTRNEKIRSEFEGDKSSATDPTANYPVRSGGSRPAGSVGDCQGWPAPLSAAQGWCNTITVGL
jgi:hypothetical protein